MTRSERRVEERDQQAKRCQRRRHRERNLQVAIAHRSDEMTGDRLCLVPAEVIEETARYHHCRVSSDIIVRPTSMPALRFPEAVASPNGKMPTLMIGLSPAAGGGDAPVCPAVRLTAASMMTIRMRRIISP